VDLCRGPEPDLGIYGDAYASTPDTTGRERRAPASRVPSRSRRSAAEPSSIIHGMSRPPYRDDAHALEGVPPAGVKAFTEYLRAAATTARIRSKTDYNVEAPRRTARPTPVVGRLEQPRPLADRPNPNQPFFARHQHFTTTHEGQIRLHEAGVREGDGHRSSLARALIRRGRCSRPTTPTRPSYGRDWRGTTTSSPCWDRQRERNPPELDEDGLRMTVVSSGAIMVAGCQARDGFTLRASHRAADRGWPGTIAPGHRRR